MFFLTHININHSHHFYHTLVSLINHAKIQLTHANTNKIEETGYF